MFSWIGNPIIKRLEVEAQDLKSEIRLRRESAGKLQAFMELATEGFIVYDSDMNLSSINKRALSIFPAGSTVENLRGRHMLDMAPSLKETGRYDAYLNIIKTGEPMRKLRTSNKELNH